MSFPRYPKYKDSGVEWLGDVPEHWHVRRLRFMSEVNPSKSEINHLDRDTVVSFLPMEAVGNDGTLCLDNEKTIGVVESGYTYFREGDVTLAKITPCFENGKGALMRGLANGIGFGTTELIVIRPRPDKLLDVYLQFLVSSREFRSLGESHMYGAGGQKRVPEPFVRNFATAFPSVTEQSKIAAFLDRETGKIDELVAEQRRLIELLKEKRQAVISHAVTKGLNPHAPTKPSGIEWLGKVPHHWRIVRIRRVGKVDQGCAFSHNIQGQDVGDVPWFKVNDMNAEGNEIEMRISENYVNNDFVHSIRPTIFPAGTVVFPRVGAALLTNKRRMLVNPAIIDDNIYGIIPEGIRSPFLHRVLLLVDMASLCSPGLVPTVTFRMIKELLIPLPPENEQDSIVEFIDIETAKLEALTTEAQRGIDLLQERRTALISAAVTGKIDVRGLAPTEAA